MAKLDQSLIAEIEVDEIPGIYTFAFTLNDSRLVNLEDGSKIPQLHLMWKHRSFNLLLNQQNELHLSSIELSLLDTDEDDQQPIVKYTTSTGNGATLSGQSSSASQTVLKSGANNDFALYRNQWHKFEGKLLNNQ